MGRLMFEGAQSFVLRPYTMHELHSQHIKFPLVRSSTWSKQLLCFVPGQGEKSEQKHTTKNSVARLLPNKYFRSPEGQKPKS